jgi:hypothetical protein
MIMKLKTLIYIFIPILAAIASCTTQKTGLLGVQKRCPSAEVRHTTKEQLIRENATRAETQMWTADELARRNNAIPEFGYLAITTKNNTIEMANPRHYEVVIAKHGEIVWRESLPEKIPNYTRGSNPYWYATTVIDMPVDPAGGFTVYTIQTIQNIRCELVFE